MDELLKTRNKIDLIDQHMAKLFEQRMGLMLEVINYKIKNNLPIYNVTRENQVIQKNLQYIHNKDYHPYYLDFIKCVMNTSKYYQQSLNKLNIGYQGIEGAFGHIATNELFEQENLVNFNSFEEVINALKLNQINYGVLPFENSYSGEVGEVLDLLFETTLYINQIHQVTISQNLMANQDATLDTIKQVYSHPQAFMQSKDFLSAYNYELIPYNNTAMAAKLVSVINDKSVAAIASKETAKIYNLKILANDINTSKDNQTKFIVLSNKLNETGNRFCLMFSVSEGSGQLAKVINIIANNGYDLQCIKSRLMKNLQWQYYFYVEVVGNIALPKTKEMLKQIESNTYKFKVLGTFTQGE